MNQPEIPATSGKERDAGFTLVELLVVIVIIGILAGIAVPAFLQKKRQASIASMRSDLRTAAALMETYAVQHGSYPGNVAQLTGELRTSPNNNIVIEVFGDETVGFCIKAVNPQVTEELFYDNTAGGLQPLGGSCAVR